MPKAIPILAALAALAAFPTPAAAQRLDHVATLPGHFDASSAHRVGDPRYVALSQLSFDTEAHVDVLDLDTQAIEVIATTRELMVRRFGRTDRALDLRIAPEGTLVVYEPARRAGLLLTNGGFGRRRKGWYAELDPMTGAVVRSRKLWTLAAGELLEPIGTDLAAGTAWFLYRTTDDQTGARRLVVQQLALATLALTDAVAVTLPVRTKSTGFEDSLRVRAAPDFSRFAIAEYDEVGFDQDPPAQVHVLDATTGTSFAVDAMPTTYGLAFTPDGRYLFLGSSERGTVERVDLAARRVDARVPGPRFLHHLVVSPDGTHLFALASSKLYKVFAVADLDPRGSLRHARALASPMQELFGGGFASADGRWVVADGRSVAIGRFAD